LRRRRPNGVSSEAALTGKTKDLGSGETFSFDPTSSVFWGQTGLHPTSDNLTITYNCFLVVDDSGWAAALNALAATSADAHLASSSGRSGVSCPHPSENLCIL
jgi:hypothetical protein